MHNRVKLASASAVFGGALLAAGGFGLANAAPPAQSVVNDGKINVTLTADGQQVGVLQDVSLKSAEALATSACASADITPEAFQALDVSTRTAAESVRKRDPPPALGWMRAVRSVYGRVLPRGGRSNRRVRRRRHGALNRSVLRLSRAVLREREGQTLSIGAGARNRRVVDVESLERLRGDVGTGAR